MTSSVPSDRPASVRALDRTLERTTVGRPDPRNRVPDSTLRPRSLAVRDDGARPGATWVRHAERPS